MLQAQRARQARQLGGGAVAPPAALHIVRHGHKARVLAGDLVEQPGGSSEGCCWIALLEHGMQGGWLLLASAWAEEWPQRVGDLGM